MASLRSDSTKSRIDLRNYGFYRIRVKGGCAGNPGRDYKGLKESGPIHIIPPPLRGCAIKDWP